MHTLVHSHLFSETPRSLQSFEDDLFEANGLFRLHLKNDNVFLLSLREACTIGERRSFAYPYEDSINDVNTDQNYYSPVI